MSKPEKELTSETKKSGDSGSLEDLVGNVLVKKNGSKLKNMTPLTKNECIGLYFSAHWCPPCRKFTPILKQRWTH